jgi:hypothetical protein
LSGKIGGATGSGQSKQFTGRPSAYIADGLSLSEAEQLICASNAAPTASVEVNHQLTLAMHVKKPLDGFAQAFFWIEG